MKQFWWSGLSASVCLLIVIAVVVGNIILFWRHG